VNPAHVAVVKWKRFVVADQVKFIKIAVVDNKKEARKGSF